MVKFEVDAYEMDEVNGLELVESEEFGKAEREGLLAGKVPLEVQGDGLSVAECLRAECEAGYESGATREQVQPMA